MNFKKLIYSFATVAMATAMAGCEGEKDLIIIEGNLPIKTTTLYMVGDATPNGWSIDEPTALEATGDDPLVFSWEGPLLAGEMKLCLTTGSWDSPFIRPKNNGEEIGTDEIIDAEFQMHSGDPDEKWRVTEAGTYLLTFDLRNWTMSSRYVSAPPAPDKTPIETETFYIVGDATPAGWNIGSPTALEKKSKYVFEYTGNLLAGEMKACTATGSFDVAFVRPTSADCKIDRNGVENDEFVYTTGPDNKWRIAESGTYRLSFDLENYTIAAEYLGEAVIEKNPIDTPTLFMIGDATPGGWSMDDATEFTKTDGYIFNWQGELVEGNMKACIERDNTFSCPFIRPATAACEISENGVASPDFVYTTAPDDQWHIAKAGTYSITFDLKNYTIAVKYISAGSEKPEQPSDAIEANEVFIIGDATPNGWSMDNATALTRSADNKYIFTWEGELKTGNMKACTERDGTFSCPFIRPTYAGCEISAAGVASPEFVYTTDPDDLWNVTEAGTYRITFDLEHHTISVTKTGNVSGGDDKDPLETKTLYMIGDATPGGWSMDNATAFTVNPSDPREFSWEGTLTTGEMKACLQPDGTFSCPFLRPAYDGCVINAAGVASPEFVYTTDPDHKWRVEKAGRYNITFNLKNKTIAVRYLD